MKKLFFQGVMMITVLHLSAQEKYAVIFSKLPVVTGEEKQLARNNIKVIKEALELQQFKASNISCDTTELSISTIELSISTVLVRLYKKVKKGDFVFLYFDLPEYKEDSDPNKLNDFSTTSLRLRFRNLALKINDPNTFFMLFDMSSFEEEIQDDLFSVSFFNKFDIKSIYSCSPHEKSSVQEGTTVFAKAVAYALKSISDLNSTYYDFFENIKGYILSYTTRQRPRFLGDEFSPLFNGVYIKYPAHFTITEKKNNSTIIINAGERINIVPGAKVKLYPAYTDNKGTPIAEGVVESTTSYSATIELDKSFSQTLDKDKVWVYITENGRKKADIKVKLNETFNGREEYRTKFNNIINVLKTSDAAKFISFVSTGGDLQIKNIKENSNNSQVLTIVNPISGMVYEDLEIKSESDLSGLKEYIKRVAQNKHLSKLKNYIPELLVDFKLSYLNENKPITKDNGYDVFFDGDTVFLKIYNNSSSKIYFNVLDFQPDAIINPLLPNRNATNSYGIPEPITWDQCMLMPFDSISLKSLQIEIRPPYGIEKLKIFTSKVPMDMESVIAENKLFKLLNNDDSSRNVTIFSSIYSSINIQDYDFEIRSQLYKIEDNKEVKVISTISNSSELGVFKHIITNLSEGKVYFNLLRQKADGNFSLLFPNSTVSDANCFTNENDKSIFEFRDSIQQYDQIVTVYADRPFNLTNFITNDKQLNDLLVDIVHNGRIAGSPLNKIGLVQELYIPKAITASRDAENIFIKLVTPKVTNERGLKILAQNQTYDVNGFAMCTDNRPVKILKINGELVSYDVNLKFFEKSLGLSNGINRVVIEAIDEKGFTATKIFELELVNKTVTAAGKGKNYFLGIGIDDYKIYNPLNNAKNDILVFSNLLEKKFGFEKINDSLLLDKAASRKNIINSIRYYLTKAGPNDNVIIYLSGHGNEDQLADGDYYFIPQDAEADDVTTFVKSNDITDNFKKINAKRCLLIVDACYSGMITNSVNPATQTLTSSGDKLSAENAPCKWIITSGRATKVSDGEIGKNSPFATILINYLREHDDEPSLKMPRLIEFLKEKVPELNKLQEPLGVSIEGRGEWIFKIPAKEK